MAASMTFQFLDVGMGDGTLVQMNDGKMAGDELLLFDFGEAKSQSDVPHEDALTYLVKTIGANSVKRKRKTPYVDVLFLSHPDPDHWNKIKELCNSTFPGYPPGTKLHFGDIWYSGHWEEYVLTVNSAESSSLVKWLEDEDLVAADVTDLADDYHASPAKPKPLLRFANDTVHVYQLSCNWPTIDGEVNPKSIVLRFDLSGQGMILCGDATKETEQHIIDTFGKKAPGLLRAFGMKIGHHGSKDSSRKEWVTAVSPQAIFASGDFVWAHPYCEAICRFINAGGGVVPDYFNQDLYYCCGVTQGAPYFNNTTRRAICMNLWYVVAAKKESLIDDETMKRFVARQDWVYGVQWQVRFEVGEAPAFNTTHAVTRLPAAKALPAFDCSTVKAIEL